MCCLLLRLLNVCLSVSFSCVSSICVYVIFVDLCAVVVTVVAVVLLLSSSYFNVVYMCCVLLCDYV